MRNSMVSSLEYTRLAKVVVVIASEPEDRRSVSEW